MSTSESEAEKRFERYQFHSDVFHGTQARLAAASAKLDDAEWEVSWALDHLSLECPHDYVRARKRDYLCEREVT